MRTRPRLSVLGAALRRPWPMAATVLAVAVTVLLGGLVALTAQTLDAILATDQGRVRFQVYWQSGADPGLVARQWAWMRALPGLVEARTFTPAQALAVMNASIGGDAVPSGPDGANPLPHTMLLSFSPPGGDPGFARDMRDRLAAVEGVAEVRYDPLAMDRAQALGSLGQRVALPLAAALALLVGLVVGNTVRLSLSRRREEMEILRLIGATEWYIRRPMIRGAALAGAVGSLLAMGLLKLLHASLAGTLAIPALAGPPAFLPAGVVAAFVAGTVLVAALAGLAAAMESDA